MKEACKEEGAASARRVPGSSCHQRNRTQSSARPPLHRFDSSSRSPHATVALERSPTAAAAAVVGVALIYLFIDEPRGQIAEEMPDGTVTLIDVA